MYINLHNFISYHVRAPTCSFDLRGEVGPISSRSRSISERFSSLESMGKHKGKHKGRKQQLKRLAKSRNRRYCYSSEKQLQQCLSLTTRCRNTLNPTMVTMMTSHHRGRQTTVVMTTTINDLVICGQSEENGAESSPHHHNEYHGTLRLQRRGTEW